MDTFIHHLLVRNAIVNQLCYLWEHSVPGRSNWRPLGMNFPNSLNSMCLELNSLKEQIKIVKYTVQ